MPLSFPPKMPVWLAMLLVAMTTASASWLLVNLAPSPSSNQPPTQQTFGRIVSLSPAITETLIQFGASDLLVGISDYCDAPMGSKPKSRVGTAITPNLEAIVALRPDLILLPTANRQGSANLERIAHTESLPWLTLEDVVGSIDRLGAITQNPAAALTLRTKLKERLDGPVPSEGPRVLLLLASSTFDGGELWFIRRNSLHGAGIEATGARNAIDKEVTGSASISVEELVRINPDIIINMVAEPNFGPEQKRHYLAHFDRLQTLDAMQKRKIGFLVGKHYMSIGPGILEFVDALELEIARLSAVPQAARIQ